MKRAGRPYMACMLESGVTLKLTALSLARMQCIQHKPLAAITRWKMSHA